MTEISGGASPTEELALLRSQVAQLRQENERLKSQSEVAARERDRLQVVLENMPVMVDAFDADWNIVFWNHECERVSGYSAGEVVGNPHAMEWMCPDPVYRQRMLRQWQELGADYRHWFRELTAKDGTIKTIAWYNVSSRVPIAPWRMWAVGIDVTEQQQQQKRIAQSEELFRTLFENSPDGLLLADARTHRFCMANKAICGMTGYDAHEILHLSVRDIHPDASLPEVLDAFEKLARGEASFFEDIPVKTKDGRILYAHIHGVRLILDGIPYLMGTFRDVTERKRLADELRKSEECFRTLFEKGPDGLVLLDARTRRVRMVNRAMCDLTGYDAEKFAQLSVGELTPKESLPELMDAFEKGLRGEFSQVSSSPLRTRDGRIVYVDINGIHLSVDGVPCVMRVFRNVTRQKQLTEALSNSEERFRTLFDKAPDGLALVDARTGCFRMANKAMCDLIGYSVDEIAQLNVRDIHPEGCVQEVLDVFEGKREGKLSQFHDYPVRRRDGRIIHVDIHGIPLTLDGSAFRISIFRDVTEIRQTQKELEEYRTHMSRLERLASLGTLSATVAHEMNQPLTVLQLTMQDCLAQLESGGSADGIVDRMKECLGEVARSAAIVARFRGFGRRSSRESSGQVNLQRVAERIVRLWERPVGRPRVRIVPEGFDRISELHGAEEDMEQIFFSLLENAVQAAGDTAGRTIVIRAVPRDASVELQFIDDCGGIAPEHVDKIFEPFFTTKGETGGTGLGLCVVEYALLRAGGKIRLENRPGRGATFILTLPRSGDQV